MTLSLIVFAATMLAAAAHAATFAVDSTIDDVDATIGDTLCATSGGRCTLRAAIQESNATSGPDVVTLPAGTYALALSDPPGIPGLPVGLRVADALSLEGEDAASTIIEGGSPAGAILHVDASSPVTIQDVALRRGTGGILHEGCCTPLRVDRVRVSQVAVGIFAETGLLANDVLVEDVGDGIFGAGMELVRAEVRRCTEGGITSIHGPLAITDSTVADCLGAGVDNLGASSSIVRSTIVRNGGGGVRNYVNSLMTIVDTTVSGNAASQGGGIQAGTLDAGLLLINSTVSGNRAERGGGIWVTGDCANVALINSTVSGNTATGDGGGIYDGHSHCGASIIDNSTIAGNIADSDGDGAGNGGGIAAFGDPMVLANSILADNLDAGAEAPDCGGQLASARYSLLEVDDGCSITGDDTGIVVGMDPALEPLADNGGRTETRALRAGSPAIDAGDPSGCRDFLGDPIATDQRGIVRPLGPTCDIGAFEFGCEDPRNDLDGDGLADACDPNDAVLAVVHVRVRPDGRGTRKTGTIELTGGFSVSPPTDVISLGALTMRVEDGVGPLEAHVWPAAECQRTSRGKLACHSDDGRFTCLLRPVRSEPTRYRLRARFRGLSLAAPFTSPLSITLSHASSIDRVGVAAHCQISNAGALACGGNFAAERPVAVRRRSN